LPPENTMSGDRWNIWTVDLKSFELIPYNKKNNIEIDYIECPPNMPTENQKFTESQQPKKKCIKRLLSK